MSARLYSWVDVDVRLQRLRFAKAWPSCLMRASAYYDALLLWVRTESELPALRKWLTEQFRERYEDTAAPVLLLEALSGEPRQLPVHFEVLDEESSPAPMLPSPSFKRVALLPDHPDGIAWPDPFPERTPPVVAFYSFKGGVGRTVHLVALLRALTERNQRALVIDADLEAPGLSALVARDGFGSPDFSLVDLLAMAHGDGSQGWDQTLRLAVQRLRGQPLRLDAVEHHFLSSYRDEDQALLLDVRPEHLTQTPETAWHLGDLFASLGRMLGVDVVLIDLRAGLSELASPLLFDPRLHRVLVTTTGVQAVEGTQLVLKQLGKLAPPLSREDLSDPEVIVSFITRTMRERPDYLEGVCDQLEDAYPTESTSDGEEVQWRIQIDQETHLTEFVPDLLHAGGLGDLMKRIGDSVLRVQVDGLIRDWQDWLLRIPSHAPMLDSLQDVQQLRKRLANKASQLEYAEQSETEDADFLVTTPLRALAQRFESQPANAVVLGAKGAGKTFTFLRIVEAGVWAAFTAHLLKRRAPPGPNQMVWPLLWSRTLGDRALEQLSRCARRSELALHAANLAETWSLTTARDRIRDALRQERDEAAWREFWFTLIAESLGIIPKPGFEFEPVRALVSFLRGAKHRVVVLLDGLEEQFADVLKDSAQQVALRALLQGVPGRLQEIPDCPLGLLVFVRQDVVSAAIPQNAGQFERLYEPFALRWDREQALRLVLWLCIQTGVLNRPKEPLESIDHDRARELLKPVWGYKLGPPQSKEARSIEFVLGALSDFKGRVQARDLVRFVRYAAEGSAKLETESPLLLPRAIRDATRPCGREKLKELLGEIAGLKEPIEKLRQAGQPDDKRSPFDPGAFGMSAADVQILETTGLAEKEGERYWLTELLRRALGFKMLAGKRPRVVYL